MDSCSNKSKYLFELGPEYFWLELRYSVARWLLRRHSALEHGAVEKKVLLDLGCGPGNCLRGLPQGLRCLGTDVEISPLRVARAVSFADVFSSDVTRLPLRAGIADFALLIDVAEHVADDGALFREACRVLRPGGLLFCTAPAYQFLWGRHDELVGHVRRYSMGSLVSGLKAGGFEVIERRSLLPISFFAFVALRLWKRIRRSREDDFFAFSPFFNSLAKTCLFAEATLSRFIPFPWGFILCAVAKKP